MKVGQCILCSLLILCLAAETTGATILVRSCMAMPGNSMPNRSEEEEKAESEEAKLAPASATSRCLRRKLHQRPEHHSTNRTVSSACLPHFLARSTSFVQHDAGPALLPPLRC